MPLTSYDLAGDDPNPMTVAEVDALKKLVDMLPSPPAIIQIGAERGCSTLAMLEANPYAFIFSIDMGERPEERENLERAGLDYRRVVRGLGKSQEIGLFWPPAWKCDLLFIDGDHRRPGIDEDIVLWKSRLSKEGIIAFHDYIPNPPAHIKGRVAEAVDAWLAEWGDFYTEILHVDRLIAFKSHAKRIDITER